VPDHARDAAALPKHRQRETVDVLRCGNQRRADDRFPKVSLGNVFGARPDQRHDLVRERFTSST